MSNSRTLLLLSNNYELEPCSRKKIKIEELVIYHVTVYVSEVRHHFLSIVCHDSLLQSIWSI